MSRKPSGPRSFSGASSQSSGTRRGRVGRFRERSRSRPPTDGMPALPPTRPQTRRHLGLRRPDHRHDPGLREGCSVRASDRCHRDLLHGGPMAGDHRFDGHDKPAYSPTRQTGSREPERSGRPGQLLGQLHRRARLASRYRPADRTPTWPAADLLRPGALRSVAFLGTRRVAAPEGDPEPSDRRVNDLARIRQRPCTRRRRGRLGRGDPLERRTVAVQIWSNVDLTSARRSRMHGSQRVFPP